MSLAEAAAVLPRGARRSAVVLPSDPAADLAALGRLAERCGRFSPLVGWETLSPRTAAGPARRGPSMPWFGDAPDHLFLDATGIAPLFGGEDPLVQQVIADVRGLGYAVRAAVADTVGAAWAVTDTGEPLTVVPPGDLDAALQPLPVSVLRLPVDVLDILARLGVLTVGQLLLLPRDGLAERFGAQIGVRLDQAFGRAPEVVVPHRPAPAYEAAVRLDFPTDRRDLLDGLFADLIERVAAELRTHGVGAVRLAGQLDCGPGDPVTFEVGLFRPSASADQLHALLRLHVERLALPGPVEQVRLRAEQTAPLERRQGELFTDEPGVTGHPLAALLERLSSRLGPRAVVRPELRADPLPERAFRYVPLIGHRPGSPPTPRPQVGRKAHRAPAADDSPHPVPEAVSFRPLRLITPPPRIDAVAVAPDGPPVAFHWQRRRHAVARHWGPERIETGWWRRGLVRRDYYRVETDAGCRFWLFRDLTDGAWYLHGSFE
jgi:protein ImuB